MTTTGSVGGDQVLLERGPLRVELVLHPFSLTVSRAGRRLLRSCGLWVADGVVHDHFVQFTEGVLAAEELSPTERGVRAEVAASGPDWIVLAVKLEGGREATLRVTVGDDRRIALELHADGEPLRLALDWDRRSEERFVGLGARHCTQLDQTGEWIETWSGALVSGGSEVVAPAPLERIPVWARSGSIVVTYPAAHVERGLGEVAEAERPLVATLWGRPRCGRAVARLADGARITWRDGEWSTPPARDVEFVHRSPDA